MRTMTVPFKRWIAGAILLLELFSAAATASVEPVRGSCRLIVAATDTLPFTDAKHKLWYAHFWDGKCTGLSTGLFSGDQCTTDYKGWNQRLDEILPDQPEPAILKNACELGVLIGFEWAKDNDVRCIHTTKVFWRPVSDKNLERLNQLLTDQSSPLAARLESVRKTVASWCPAVVMPQPNR